MQNTPSRALKTALVIVVVGIFGSASAPTTSARQARPSAAKVKENTGAGNQKAVRELGKKTSDVSDITQRLNLANEDFDRLKAANNDIVKMISSKDALSLKRVAEETQNVRERAEHLRGLLALPEPEKAGKAAEKEEREGPNAEQMKPWLRALTDLITSFVTNPVFKSEKEVDAKLAAQARRDLEEIIDLSELIRKSAGKLAKSSGR